MNDHARFYDHEELYDDDVDYESRYSSPYVMGLFSNDTLDVSFTGVLEHTDYGVPGSPTLTSVERIDITSVSILGVDIDYKILPTSLQDKLFELSEEVDWESPV
jgi:hypothetical protein